MWWRTRETRRHVSQLSYCWQNEAVSQGALLFYDLMVLDILYSYRLNIYRPFISKKCQYGSDQALLNIFIHVNENDSREISENVNLIPAE